MLCGLKPNKASLDLNKLTKDQLLDMKKHGNSTYYVISEKLQEKINSLGLRTKNKDLLNEIIIELCRIRLRSIDELAKIIHRTDNYVKNNIVTPLRKSGKLCFTIPEMKNHPGQKYTVK